MDLSDSWTDQPVAGQRIGAVQFVLRDLTDAIYSGVARVGERLPSEAALAARYSVSRSVIREVLRALEARGLTLTRAGKGTFVVAERATDRFVFGEYTATHLLEARPHIEVPAAGLAALRRTESELERLQELSEAMAAETDSELWVSMDSSFHVGIAEASHNPVFVHILRAIRAALSEQSGLLDRRVGRRSASDEEHRAVLTAIARSASLEAEDAMAYHLDQVRDAVVGHLPDPTGC